jgi:hypothetical protein
MASITPIVIRCIEYLAYGTVFMRVMFRPNIKPDVLFFARKAIDEPWEVVNRQASHSGPKNPNPKHDFGGCFYLF